jgi:ABC-type polar amino acid transport system ATPase subunit
VEGGHAVTTPVLDVQDIHLRRGTREILRGVSFTATRGEIVVIMGPSGSGKTTILRAIAGLDRRDSGRINVEGGRAGMVFQFHCLFEHLSALENICLAPVHAHGVSRDEANRRGRELLAAFGVEHRAAALPRELSGGEAQRVAIARALAVDPDVLLLDEPTASLDPDRRAELGSLLLNLAREGRTLVVATHDEDFARAYATRTLRLLDGTFV